MGEISEMMLDGTLDYITGEYLGHGHGFPRTKGGSRRKSPRRAHERGIKGIKSFLYSVKMPHKDMYGTCIKFLERNGVQRTNKQSWRHVSDDIQSDWETFKTWINNETNN